jgi:hypothetical protein
MLFDGRSISLLPHDQIAEIHLQRGARTAQDIDAEELRSVLVEDAAVFAACTGSSYLSRLRNIQRRARTVSEETGTNNLFVSLATLEWEDAGRQARAPLFLLPVTLQTYRGRPFTMQIEQGGYAEPNQCLLEKLRIGHGLSIPAFRDPETDASGIDLAGSLQAIRLALLDARLPFTIEESAHLSLLQFSTLQLWQDLSDNWETFLRNPVVRHLVETPTDSFTDPAAGVPLPPDPEARTYCPIAVDGSQLEAVDWAEAGRSFVLEGPPGTGKSQTITNLIANALAAGKTILFVAEKQAALDVVRRRLDKVGLGELCLDLHGKDQTPENMRKQLRLALHLEHSGNAASWAELRARHQGSVDSLGRYPSALHEPGGAGLSAWTARQSLLTAGEGPTVEIPPTVVAQQLDTETLFRVARELTQALYDLGAAVNAHPWRLAQLERLEEDGLRARVREAVAALYEASGALAEGPVADLLGSDGSPDALAIVGDWLEAITQIGWSPDAATVVAASQPEWRSRLDAARRALAAVRADSSSLLATFTPEVITEVDIDALLIRGKAADAKIFKGKARKAVAADLASSLRPDAPVDPKTVTPTLEALLALRSSAREMSREAQGLPGLDLPDWNPLADDAPSALEARVAVIEKSVQLVEKLPAASEVLGHAPSGSFSEPATEQVQRLGEAWGALTSLLGASARAIDAWRGTQRPLLAAIRTALPAWNVDAQTGGLVQLSRWCQVQAHLAAFTAAGLDGLVAEITAGTLHPDEIEPVLRRSIARAALEERVSSTILAGFDGLARDRAIERFSSGADEMRRDMVTELPAKIVSQRSFSPERLVGKVGQLSRELTRKRGGEKIRGLFENYGPIIGELTPCLMMSPHSVARFLPPDALDIDLVVFDEASQIKVAESISAMGRAKATVVVGDSQQMPPTNVAAVGSASEEEEGQGPLSIPSDMESVLSEAVESNLPRLWLSWHYRSQHESLISFSNHQYYEGRLASFPRPPEARSDLGVSWRRVDGTFERGRERVNRVEASTIVAEIRARLTAAADASIGVVTFNTQQRDLILDLLEECGDARVATALAADQESLFVKNLENVQGDERDVILFSLAFSRNPETGKLPLNFGPLLQAGGERRLNVAVTRARAQVVLFSSFDPHDIDLSRSSSVGLAHLRSYMEMAQREAGDPGLLRPQAARDHHHEDVVEALEAAGLHVREHVGQSDFAVDIGVAAAPEGPWVAVFLDGPGYAKRATVGDRESLPHGVLVGSMGWARVERVWLPDWVRDRAEVVQRIVRAAREPAPVEPAVVPEPSSPLPALRDSFAELQAVSSSTGAPSSPRALMEAGTQANAGRSQPELPVFTPAHDHLVGFRDQLDSITFDAHSRVAVYAEVQDIIAHEGPVETTRLARLACRRFDLHRVAPQRVSDVVGLIPPGQLDHTPFGTFAWPEGQDRTAYRDFRLAPADGARIVEEVAPQEIINSMSYLARVGGGISREELLREMALLFGVRRLTAKVRWHLEAVLDFAVEHLLLHDDGRSITSIAAGPA